MVEVTSFMLLVSFPGDPSPLPPCLPACVRFGCLLCRWLTQNEHLAKAADDPSQLDPDVIIAGGL